MLYSKYSILINDDDDNNNNNNNNNDICIDPKTYRNESRLRRTADTTNG